MKAVEVDEPDGFFAIKLEPNFPLEDLRTIGIELIEAGTLVPGYIPPERGMLDILALRYAHDVEGLKTIVLPDRNIVSRIARIAEGGARRPFDKPTATAANLMAFSQCLNFDFDPLMAFHELAHANGNEIAHHELAWFRAGDEAQAQVWVDLARGRRDGLTASAPGRRSDEDLAAPIGRWARNYVVALKIAELELSGGKPFERAVALLDWMLDDFFLAGPAAMFASMYFSPLAEKKRLIKQLRSQDRERAIAGVRNAAWDMTHLSNFSRRMRQEGDGPCRYILATADRGLAAIATFLVIDAEESQLEGEISARLRIWWPRPDAKALGAEFAARLRAVVNRPPPEGPENLDDPIAHWTSSGEAFIREWRPR